MDSKEAVAMITEALQKVSFLRSKQPYCPEHVEFMQTTGLELTRIFGPDSVVVRNFTQIPYSLRGSFPVDALSWQRELASKKRRAFLDGLDMAEGVLRSAKDQLEKYGVEEMLKESRLKVAGARIFISHGVQTPALDKVERFVRAMGLSPVIVIREASQGMAVDDLVDARMDECDCAIILATADEEINGRRQPRPNVTHEIGLAQEKFGNRIIYLKETGSEFPSNVQPKVWGSFTQENMETAFEKISKELHAFGFI